jgi:hypothetical protein
LANIAGNSRIARERLNLNLKFVNHRVTGL